MSRPDASISYLKSIGYSVLKVPRSDVLPLQTLLRSDKRHLTRLGELENIMESEGVPLPDISRDNVAPAEISGQESSAIKLEIGLSILGNIIHALSGGTLGVTSGYERAKTVTFRYQGVQEDHVDLDRLDHYLSTAKVKSNMNTVINALIDDEVYVITSTLKSKNITVTASAGNNVSAGLDVPVIKQAASGTLEVDVSHASQGKISYEGDVPVVYGFQAVRLFFDDQGNYTTFDPMDPGTAAARAANQMRPTHLTPEGFVFFKLENP